MAPQPQRRAEAQRKNHLDASVVPVERALLHRADELERGALELRTAPADHGMPPEAAARVSELFRYMSAEFRLLAEELHYW